MLWVQVVYIPRLSADASNGFSGCRAAAPDGSREQNEIVLSGTGIQGQIQIGRTATAIVVNDTLTRRLRPGVVRRASAAFPTKV